MDLNTQNQAQGHWILAQGWLPQAILNQAFQEIGMRPGADLVSILVERNFITHSQAESVRLAVNQSSNPSYFPESGPHSVSAPMGLDRPVNPIMSSSGGLSVASPAHSMPNPHLDSSQHPLNPNQIVKSPGLKALLSQRMQVDFVGRKFGQYEIIQEISRGGMGVILMARTANVGNKVALKLLLEDDKSDASFARFKQEAQVLAKLTHPGIVRVKSFGREEDIPFFAMDLIEGQDLKLTIVKHMQETDSVPGYNWTSKVMKQVAEALAYCHKENVLHRDVKPANVLIEDGTDRPVLADFGLVKLKGDNEDAMNLSVSGDVRGTPAYMAPEQADPNGDFGSVGKKTDVWGFGATLFFCLTGQSPYEGESATNIYVALMREDPPRVHDFNPDVPKWLDELTGRCLQRKAARRLPMSQVAHILELGLEDPGQALDQLGSQVSESSGGRWVAAVFAVIVFVGFLVGLWSYHTQQLSLERAKILAGLQGELENVIREAEAKRKKTFVALLESLTTIPKRPSYKGFDELLQKEKTRVALVQEEPEDESLWKEDQSALITSLKSDLTALHVLCSLRRGRSTNIVKAEALLETIPEKHRVSTPVIWAFSVVYSKSGKIGKAIEHYKALLIKEPRQSTFYQAFAKLYLELGKSNDAADVLDAALRRLSRADQNPHILSLLLDLDHPEKNRKYLPKIAQLRFIPSALAEKATRLAWMTKNQGHLAQIVPFISANSWKDPIVSLARCQLLLKRRRPETILNKLANVNFTNDVPNQLKLLETKAAAYWQKMELGKTLAVLEVALKLAESLGNKVKILEIHRDLLILNRSLLGPKGGISNFESAQKVVGPNGKPEELRALQEVYLVEAGLRAILGPFKMRSIERMMHLIKQDPKKVEDHKKLQKNGRAYLDSIAQMLEQAGRLGGSNEITKQWKAHHSYHNHNIEVAGAFQVSPDDHSPLAELLRAKARWGTKHWLSNGRSRGEAVQLFYQARRTRRSDLQGQILARARWLVPVINKSSNKALPKELIAGLRFCIVSRPLDPVAYKCYIPTLALKDKKAFQKYLENSMIIDPTDPETIGILGRGVAPKDKARVFSWAVFCDRIGGRKNIDKAFLLLEYAGVLRNEGKMAESLQVVREAVKLCPYHRTIVERGRNLCRNGGPDHQTFDRRLQEIIEKGAQVLAKAQACFKEKKYSEARQLAAQCPPYLSRSEQSEAQFLESATKLFRKDNNAECGTIWEDLGRIVASNHELAPRLIEYCFNNELGDAEFHRSEYKRLIRLQPANQKGLPGWRLILAAHVLGFCDGRSTVDAIELYETELKLQDYLLNDPKAHGVRFMLGILRVLDQCPLDAAPLLDDVLLLEAYDPTWKEPLLYALRAKVAAETGDLKGQEWWKKAREAGFQVDSFRVLFQSPAARELIKGR
jgi:serine/threonine protein kinase/tetratricopeptide (TPR) repeat protein